MTVRDRRPPRPRSDEGSASVFVIGIVLVLFAVVGLVADGGRAVNARVAIVDDAEQAARAAANQLDVAHLRATGEARIDPGAARDAAVDFLSVRGYAPGRMTVTAAQDEVTVEVEDVVPTVLLQLAGVDTFTVEGSATARAAVGIVTEIGGAP